MPPTELCGRPDRGYLEVVRRPVLLCWNVGELDLCVEGDNLVDGADPAEHLAYFYAFCGEATVQLTRDSVDVDHMLYYGLPCWHSDLRLHKPFCDSMGSEAHSVELRCHSGRPFTAAFSVKCAKFQCVLAIVHDH